MQHYSYLGCPIQIIQEKKIANSSLTWIATMEDSYAKCFALNWSNFVDILHIFLQEHYP